MKKLLMGLLVAAGLAVTSVAAEAATLVAHVSLSTQTMTVTKYGRVLYVWPVSTARKGYVTPRGSFRPTRMHKMWRSRKYDDAPMPFSVFYHGGYAVHGTSHVKALGRPASHGCVRLRTANAAAFFSLVKQIGPGNTRIVVAN